MTLGTILCRAIQGEWVIVKSSNKTWSPGEGNGRPLQHYCLENLMTVWKSKKIWHHKMSPPGWKGSHMLLEKSGGQLLIAPKRMKWLDRSRNDSQWWMWLEVPLKSKAVKNNIEEKPGLIGPWIKVNGMWSSRRCQDWT